MAASCATTPPTGVPEDRYLEALGAGRAVYLVLDLAQTRDLAPAVAEVLGLPADQIASGLERAFTVYGALGDRAEETPFYALVLGRFPSSGLGLALKRKDGWRPVPGERGLFRNIRTGIEMRVLEPGVLALSNGGIGEIRLPEAARPEDLWGKILPLRSAGDLVVYAARAPAALTRQAGQMAESVLTLWMRARRLATDAAPLDTPLEVDLGFGMKGEREARLFRPVLRLVLVGMARNGALPGGMAALGGVRDESQGTEVVMAGIRLTLGQALDLARELTAPEGAPLE